MLKNIREIEHKKHKRTLYLWGKLRNYVRYVNLLNQNRKEFIE